MMPWWKVGLTAAAAMLLLVILSRGVMDLFGVGSEMSLVIVGWAIIIPGLWWAYRIENKKR